MKNPNNPPPQQSDWEMTIATCPEGAETVDTFSVMLNTNNL